MIARFKITQPIIAVTPDAKVKRQLELIFGVEPVMVNYLEKKDRIWHVGNRLCAMGIMNEKETVLFTAAVRTTMKHASNAIEIHKIEELKRSSSS
jgi:pyruvate kinase